jgi:membrane associated rhomboid family serine protease
VEVVLPNAQEQVGQLLNGGVEGHSSKIGGKAKNTMEEEKRSLLQELREQFSILGGFVALIWVLEILDNLLFQRILRGGLDQFGVYPRTFLGLRGLVFAPFLHGSYYHVAANTVPFLVLGWLIMLRNTADFWTVSVVSALVSGLGTWLFGRSAYHIGASGMIFGYFGYLLFRGYFERSITAIAISLIVIFAYGSMIYGVLPTQPWISWEGHLFGFIGGAIAAKLLVDQQQSQGSSY